MITGKPENEVSIGTCPECGHYPTKVTLNYDEDIELETFRAIKETPSQSNIRAFYWGIIVGSGGMLLLSAWALWAQQQQVSHIVQTYCR